MIPSLPIFDAKDASGTVVGLFCAILIGDIHVAGFRMHQHGRVFSTSMELESCVAAVVSSYDSLTDTPLNTYDQNEIEKHEYYEASTSLTFYAAG
ncbi:hypothetical protein Poly51_58520 [Rubripirellula tenax]|uniref:Uncharacterized protein n=1 Tax=Rubripirellula tenax TaxID=2528015 RepID=A0A5C6EBA7_9BACT|nr:hypothetical protein Poly51_58520 [Rubripirellula tenax]